jgi:hypothetical protein
VQVEGNTIGEAAEGEIQGKHASQTYSQDKFGDSIGHTEGGSSEVSSRVHGTDSGTGRVGEGSSQGSSSSLGGNSTRSNSKDVASRNGKGRDDDVDANKGKDDKDIEMREMSPPPEERWLHLLFGADKEKKHSAKEISFYQDDTTLGFALNWAFRDDRGYWRAATAVNRIRLTMV